MSIALELQSGRSDERDVVERAGALVERLRSRHGETDRLSKPPDETSAELEAAGLFKLTVPRAYGGLETSRRITHSDQPQALVLNP